METKAEVLGALDEVRLLLVDGHATSIHEAQPILSRLIGSFERTPEQLGGEEVSKSVRLISFLLKKADDFWRARQVGTVLNHYSSGGFKLLPSAPSTIVLDA